MAKTASSILNILQTARFVSISLLHKVPNYRLYDHCDGVRIKRWRSHVRRAESG
jgi:hypothetical protein